MGIDKEEKESKQRARKTAALEVGGGILEARGGQSFTGRSDGLDQMLLSAQERRSLSTLIRAFLCSHGVGGQGQSRFDGHKNKIQCHSSSLKEKIQAGEDTKSQR